MLIKLELRNSSYHELKSLSESHIHRISFWITVQCMFMFMHIYSTSSVIDIDKMKIWDLHFTSLKRSLDFLGGKTKTYHFKVFLLYSGGTLSTGGTRGWESLWGYRNEKTFLSRPTSPSAEHLDELILWWEFLMENEMLSLK